MLKHESSLTWIQDSLRSIFGPYGVLVLVCIVGAAATYQVFRFFWPRTLTYFGLPATSLSSKPPSYVHIWTQGGPFDRGVPTFCNACGKAIVLKGIRCLKHHVPSTDQGMAPADHFGHQWVQGNLHLIPDARCTVCNATVGLEPAMADCRCSCLGPIPNLIVPPWHVLPNTTSSLSKRRNATSTNQPRLRVQLPGHIPIKPLICLVNPRSGAQEAPILLRSLYQILNPIQIIDITRQSPEEIFKAFGSCLSRCQVLVCGGDGTIGWILQVLDKLCPNPRDRPPVGTLPMGTGNDLGRTLGWGGGWTAAEDVLSIINAIKVADVVELDRWCITITSLPPPSPPSPYKPTSFVRGFSSKSSTRPAQKTIVKVCNNYFSVGADARIALDFHRVRESQPHFFRNRFVNKGWYALLGGRQIALNVMSYLGITFKMDLEKEEAALPDSPQHSKLVGATLQLDTSPIIHLDHLGGAVILNIPSYGGGAQIYAPLQSIGAPLQYSDDGAFEALGVLGPLHMGALIAGLSSPEMLGQASKARLHFPMISELPMQLDGEPFLHKGPCTVDIAWHSRVKMLKRREWVMNKRSRYSATSASDSPSTTDQSCTDGSPGTEIDDLVSSSSPVSPSAVFSRRSWTFRWW
ncbi:diacylglycerol kinase (ATP) [Synchytrium endobioticum]|uniref:Diacylglycerol kinase n=1 Tax=Synchytrium endobioticum TaxID=286115 RepID=A0A507DIN8_9FUNG|nr:diacylglycerol kinase (ATP) [Synchytrium endobioticum]